MVITSSTGVTKVTVDPSSGVITFRYSLYYTRVIISSNKLSPARYDHPSYGRVNISSNTLYHQACNGIMQSPIDIVTGPALVPLPLPLDFGNYDKVMVVWVVKSLVSKVSILDTHGATISY